MSCLLQSWASFKITADTKNQAQLQYPGVFDSKSHRGGEPQAMHVDSFIMTMTHRVQGGNLGMQACH